ncbi:unnamed protein product [Camellia sinensis]
MRNETFEKLGTLGTSSNLLVYLTTVFNMDTITSTNLINIFNGTCNFGTLLGAFLSDTYFGRYKTLGFASISSFLGMLILTLTAAISTLHPRHRGSKESSSCKRPTPWQMAFLLSGFGLLVVGASGIRPCNLAFGADQFNPKTASGKRAISSFFNWYYFTFTFAMMVSLTVIVYVQSNVNWALGLAIPAFLMFLSCAVFFIGTRIYVMVIPQGSPLTSVVQVIVAAIKNRVVELPEQPLVSLFNHVPSNSINSKLPYSDQFRKLGNTGFLIPAASYSIFQMVSLTIWIPIYDRLIVPILRKLTKKEDGITILQKMGIGMIIAVFTMIVSAIVEKERRTLALTRPTLGIESRKGEISSMSGLWLIAQLTLAGFSEAFTIIGQVEFFYKQFPENMRSIAGSFLFCGFALSSYLSTFLVSIVHRATGGSGEGNWLPEDLNKGRLDCFYYLIAGLEVLNLGYFLVCAKWYKFKGASVNTPDVAFEKMPI